LPLPEIQNANPPRINLFPRAENQRVLDQVPPQVEDAEGLIEIEILLNQVVNEICFAATGGPDQERVSLQVFGE
ncbi:MAG TPA: hypothetical protein VMI31_06900, partial [Fimbriimonadaceae bacterium]|nr:hypothetical protein [Fimbriimonadaceae bacterium]